jgi:hypothetical protein
MLEVLIVARMTKTQAKKRLAEAHEKVRRVYLDTRLGTFTPAQEKKLSQALDLIANVSLHMK